MCNYSHANSSVCTNTRKIEQIIITQKKMSNLWEDQLNQSRSQLTTPAGESHTLVLRYPHRLNSPDLHVLE